VQQAARAQGDWPMGLSTPIQKVQKLQTALQAKAKSEPGYRFYSLWDKVCRRDVLIEAYERCRANGGAAGVDRVTFEQIDSAGAGAWLDSLRQELTSRSYRCQPLLRVWCPFGQPHRHD
jgi:RNA-directed DNA polymerase